MQTIKIMSLVMLGALLLFIGMNRVSPGMQQGSEVFNLPLSKTHAIVGYKNNDDSTGQRYKFYVKDGNQQLNTPFLITNTLSINIETKDPSTLLLSLKGKIYQFTNNILLHTSNGLEPIAIELMAKG